MSRIFLSHSSQNNFAAIAIRDWLNAEGWDDVFLDIDPERGIVGGERWERKLHEAASRCEAVVFLISAQWLASEWCVKEYSLARGLNKKLFAVLIDPNKSIGDIPATLTGTWQVVDLAHRQDMQIFRVPDPNSHEEQHVTFSREGLRKLKSGLEKAGLDPKFFAWPPPADPNRAPYRGLEPLEAADAGIFFGRDAPIIEFSDALRGLRAAAAPRLLVILGASGAGKSSFLRAGVLPRLARDDSHFLPLPPIRPERAALTGEYGLLAALETSFPDRTRAELRTAIKAGAAGVRPLLTELARKTFRQALMEGDSCKLPTIVIAIDQSEELFRAEGAEEGHALLELVRDLTMADDPAIIAIFAIRSDSYDALQNAKPLENLPQKPLSLPPMPHNCYRQVIERPAQRVVEAGRKLAIEPQLIDRLLEDIEKGGGKDALPLLSFTLEQLYREFGRAGLLKLRDYEAFGGLKGTIDAAVERAFVRADGNPRIPRDRVARATLLRRGLIPWLAGVDPDSKSLRRNMARRDDIPAEAAPLIDLLVEERLLSTDTTLEKDQTGKEVRIATIEPAHEALLRQWSLLEGWLNEDFGLLATLEGVKRAARDWDANGRPEAWLAHQGQRLTEAQRLDVRPDIAARLDATDRSYLVQCRALEDARRAEADKRLREREEEQARRLADAHKLAAANRRIAIASSLGLVIAVTLATVAGYSWKRSEDSLRVATTSTSALVDTFGIMQPIAKLDQVKTIIDKTRKLIETLTQSTQDTDAIFQKSRVLLVLSQLENTGGNIKAMNDDATAAKMLLDSIPGTEGNDWHYQHANAYLLMGWAVTQFGKDKEGAEQDFKKGIAEIDALIAAQPKDPLIPQWKRLLSDLEQELGDAYVQQFDDPQAALKVYQDSYNVRLELEKQRQDQIQLDNDSQFSHDCGGIVAPPVQPVNDTNPYFAHDLVDVANKLGDVEFRLGNNPCALDLYRKALDRMSRLGYWNILWSGDLSLEDVNIGRVEMSNVIEDSGNTSQEIDDAIGIFEHEQPAIEQVVAQNPNNAVRVGELAWVTDFLGAAMLIKARATKNRVLLAKASAMLSTARTYRVQNLKLTSDSGTTAEAMSTVLPSTVNAGLVNSDGNIAWASATKAEWEGDFTDAAMKYAEAADKVEITWRGQVKQYALPDRLLLLVQLRGDAAADYIKINKPDLARAELQKALDIVAAGQKEGDTEIVAKAEKQAKDALDAIH